MPVKPKPFESKSFKACTGLMGATDPNQKVTPENIRELPEGSVVQLEGIGNWLTHLHDNLWLYTSGCAHCYDRVERLATKGYLDGANISHIPPFPKSRSSVSLETAQKLADILERYKDTLPIKGEFSIRHQINELLAEFERQKKLTL